MTRQSAPHYASTRKQPAKQAKAYLEAVRVAYETERKHKSDRVISPHQIAAEAGAVAAIAKLAATRAESHDGAMRPARETAQPGRAAGASPTSNTGGKVQNVELVTSGRKVKIVSVRDNSASGQCAIIDTLSVVFHVATLRKLAFINRAVQGGYDENTDDLVLAFNETFKRIFGVSITRRHKNGRNFYESSYEIGDGLGHLALGGNNETVQLHLDGKGCLTAAEGWEHRLHDWLAKVADEPRITRIDLAHDDFAGDVTVDHMFGAYHHGAFTNGGRPPRCELRGDWIAPDGAGRTIYIGSRENGLLYRGYEKGREQGDPDHPWVRHEIQLGNKCRVIPLNCLIFPGQYFAGAYQALSGFADRQVRIETERKQCEASFKHVVEVAKNQCGRAINLMMDILKDPAKVVAELQREGYPKAFAHYDADHNAEFQPVPAISDEVFFDHAATSYPPNVDFLNFKAPRVWPERIRDFSWPK